MKNLNDVCLGGNRIRGGFTSLNGVFISLHVGYLVSTEQYIQGNLYTRIKKKPTLSKREFGLNILKKMIMTNYRERRRNINRCLPLLLGQASVCGITFPQVRWWCIDACTVAAVLSQ